MKEWISIYKELPDYSGDYLIAYGKDSSKIAIAYFIDGDGIFYSKQKREIKSVKFWQHISSPFEIAKMELYKHLSDKCHSIDPDIAEIVNRNWKKLLW